MLRFYFAIAAAVLIAGFSNQHAMAQDFDKPEATPVNGEIDWVYDYEAGKQKSLETGKPMFVVFRCER